MVLALLANKVPTINLDNALVVHKNYIVNLAMLMFLKLYRKLNVILAKFSTLLLNLMVLAQLHVLLNIALLAMKIRHAKTVKLVNQMLMAHVAVIVIKVHLENQLTINVIHALNN